MITASVQIQSEDPNEHGNGFLAELVLALDGVMAAINNVRRAGRAFDIEGEFHFLRDPIDERDAEAMLNAALVKVWTANPAWECQSVLVLYSGTTFSKGA